MNTYRIVSILILVLLFSTLRGQQRLPKDTIATVKSVGYFRYGYVRPDSGYIFTERDTFLARYPTLIKHINHKFYYTEGGTGSYWKEFTGTGATTLTGATIFRAKVGQNIDGLDGPAIGQITYTPTITQTLLKDNIVYFVFRNNLLLLDYDSIDYSVDPVTGTMTVTKPFIANETFYVYYGAGSSGGNLIPGSTTWNNISGKPVNITQLAALSIPNDNILQKKSGNLTSRTPAQLKADLLLNSTDVGLNLVTNNPQLKIASNLSDLNNVSTARINLGLGTLAVLNGIAATDVISGILNPDRLASGTALQIYRRNAANTGGEFATISIGAGTGDMVAANNLSDLTSIPTARTNLGLGSIALLNTIDAATHITTGVLSPDRLAAGSALQLVRRNTGNTALEYFTFSGMAGSNNLSELTNATTARFNLGLGSLATQNGTFSGIHSGTTSGTNTGDETITTIKSKLGITTLSGSNTGDQDLSTLVVKNSSITGATKTKITYDTKGLVLSGTDATTSDIAEGSNLYFTSARARTAISLTFTTTGTSGASTGAYNNATGIFTINVPQYTGGGSVSPFSPFIVLTGSPSFSWTYSAYTAKDAKFTITANSTLAISGDIDGDQGTLVVTQNGTGGWDLTVPVTDLLQDGIAVVGSPHIIDLEDAPGSVNELVYKKVGSVRLWSKGYYK